MLNLKAKFVLLFLSLGIINSNRVFSQATTTTFSYTGTVQTFTVPPCVTTLTVNARGAEGGGPNGLGGNGSVITATMAVTPGQVLEIRVGGMGSVGNNSGGYNGGGTGRAAGTTANSSGGGGGATDIRIAPYGLVNRVIIAGGGGGFGGGTTDAAGGGANCNNGAAGVASFGGGGGGGTQFAGGAGGTPWGGGSNGQAGAIAQGGNGAIDNCYNNSPGGGGGGGYYGGGGGGADCFSSAPYGGGAGGGGSSLVPAGGACSPNSNTGNGQMILSYQAAAVPTTASNTGPYCAGATIQLNTPVAGATYSWSGPQTFTANVQNPTRPNATSAMAGVYSVTVTSNGCTSTATTTVSILPSPTLTVNSPSICLGQGTATLTASGANTYSWSAGTIPSTGATVTTNPSANTNYTVTGTAANGCTATAVSSVTVNSLPQVIVNSTAICNGQGTATLTASGANTYSWSTGTAPSSGSTVNANPTSQTNYTVTGTDVNGCTNTAVATVSVNALPTINVNSPSICLGATATLNASGASTYTWSTGTTPNSGPTVSVTPISTEQFTVTGTDANGCFSSATSTVSINPNPTVDAGADDTICQGNTVILLTNLSAGATATWNPGALTGPAQVFSATATTTYTLNVIDANGCTGIDSITITVPNAITLDMDSIPASCNGICDAQASVLPTPSPNSGPFTNYTYFWQGTNSTNSTVNGLCVGSYTVTVTNDAGCFSTGTVTVTQPTALTASASNTLPTSCNGVCDGSTTVTANGGTGNYNYSWSPSGSGFNPNNLCAGNYTCTVNDANNCSVTVPIVISQPAVLTASINPVSTICIGQTATLTVVSSGGNGGNTFNWSPGTTPNNTSTVNVSPVTTSSYSVIVTDVNGCATAPITITVSVSPPLNVVAGQNLTICNGQSTSLSAVASGGNGVYNYSWVPSTTPSTGSTVSVSPNSTTTYTVTVTDGCGTPSSTDQIIVNVNQLPTLSISSSTPAGCNPVCATFTANSTIGLNNVSWTFTDGQTTTGIVSNSVCFDSPGIYGATINVIDINNCQSTFTNNNLVTSFPVPVAEFYITPPSSTILTPNVTFLDQTSGAVITNWTWSFGDPTDAGSTQQNPSFTYPTVGTYDVWLTVVSNNGCTDSVNHPVVIEPEFVIYVPNAFTPNGDGVNDVFYPQGMGINFDTYELLIFDRWGNMIFSTNDFNEFWDGKPSGKDEIVMQDVYVWKLKTKTFDGTIKNYSGHVSVIR